MNDDTRIPTRLICGARCGVNEIVPLNQDEIHRAILYASCPRCGAAYSVLRLGEP